MTAIYYAVLDSKHMIPNANLKFNCNIAYNKVKSISLNQDTPIIWILFNIDIFAWNHNWACVLFVSNCLWFHIYCIRLLFLRPLIMRERTIKAIKGHALAIFKMHNCILWHLHYLVILLYANYWCRCLFMICYSGIICLQYASTHLKWTATKQQRFMYRYEFVLQ